jgi:hypothetical protein
LGGDRFPRFLFDYAAKSGYPAEGASDFAAQSFDGAIQFVSFMFQHFKNISHSFSPVVRRATTRDYLV